MSGYGYSYTVNCHWCGKSFETKKPKRRHHFCCAACKMAHYRAYKKYVTEKRQAAEACRRSKVTRKKSVKKKNR